MLPHIIFLTASLLSQDPKGIRPSEIASPRSIPASLMALSGNAFGVQINELWNAGTLSYSSGYVLSYKVDNRYRLSFVGRQDFGIEHPVIIKSTQPLTFEQTKPYLASPPWSGFDLEDCSEQDFIHWSASGVYCTLKKWVYFKTHL